MKPKTALRGIALFSGCWVIVTLSGCSGPQVQQTESDGKRVFSSQPSDIGAKQLDPLLVRVSQLQVATLEALDAARMVGTAESQLTEALQYLASASTSCRLGGRPIQASSIRKVWSNCAPPIRPFDRLRRRPCALVLNNLNVSWWPIMGASSPHRIETAIPLAAQCE